MDDASQHFGHGEQRGHPRPFFYVQPPSQPYYVYPPQWQLSNPYSHYGLPAGFNQTRPCMPPYPYMPYPGFVLPQAPLYPVDYRRMFEPRFQHASTWGDAPRQQHHPQPHGRRETTCSGAQTDPSDAISKLIECLDKIRAADVQSADRELDSGIASQSAGLSPREEKNVEEKGRALSTPRGCLGSPAATFMDSTAAVYDGESNQVMMDPLSPQAYWTEHLDEELPLDSSSLHECSHFVSLEQQVTDIQTNISVSDSSVLKCDAEEHLKATPSSKLSLKEANSSDDVSNVEHLETSDEVKPDKSCQILRLPFESVLTPGRGGLSSPSASYYNYLMQTTHERMSVLSPSLDELSSRDEMFSTDLDDADFFPQHVYAGKRLTDVDTGSPQAADADDPLKLWLPYTKKLACSCCGRSVTSGTSRSRGHSPKLYMDKESEEENRYGRGCEQPVRVLVRKHSAHRRTHPVSPRRAAKPWRSQYVHLSEAVKQEDQVEATEAETEELDSSELPCRTCEDGLCREDVTTPDRGRWTNGDAVPRRRRGVPQQRQEMSAHWKQMYHRPQDDHDEEAPHHWERGCTVKEPRC